MTYRQLYIEASRRAGWSEEKIRKATVFSTQQMIAEFGVEDYLDKPLVLQPGATEEEAVNAMANLIRMANVIGKESLLNAIDAAIEKRVEKDRRN